MPSVEEEYPGQDPAAPTPRRGDTARAVWGDGLIARRAPERAPRSDGAGTEWTEGDPTMEPAAEDGAVVPEQATTSAPDRGTVYVNGQADARTSTPAGHGGSSGAAAAPEEPPADDELRQRLVALRELLGLSRTRLPEAELAEAARVLDEAHARGRLPRNYTTVAIAGATGSGKSSLFNALAGTRFSETGMRRPTTSAPIACTWEAPGAPSSGTDGADGLLDRLGIAPGARRRLRTPQPQRRGGSGGVEPAEDGLGGLVLIDLPDLDSLAEENREQVDRLLRLVDAVVWVADPEKYADAVLHERYLRPLAGHAEVTFVVLNQTDRLPGEATGTVLDDLRRLLDEDGMALGEHGEPGAQVLATSALSGDGVAELRAELGTFVAGRRGAALRLTADLDGAVQRLRPVYAEPGKGAAAGSWTGLTDEVREDFEDRLASAAGAVAAGQAAERGWLRQAEHACGTTWARLARWWSARHTSTGETDPTGQTLAGQALLGLRAESARRAGGSVAGEPDGDGDGEQQRVARPVVDVAVRELAEHASAGLPHAWQSTVQGVARRGTVGLPEALDAALLEVAPEDGAGPGAARLTRTPGGRKRTAGAPSGPAGSEESDACAAEPNPRGGVRMAPPTWWRVTAWVQGVLCGLQVLGVLWMLADLFGFGGGVGPLPLAVAGGAAVGAPLLAWACRLAARGPARAYGLERERELRRLAVACGRARVLEPVAAELLRYREVREQYVIAAGGAERA